LELFLYNFGFVLIKTDFVAKNNPWNHVIDQHVLQGRAWKLPSYPTNRTTHFQSVRRSLKSIQAVVIRVPPVESLNWNRKVWA
jgi:hypothetical protein